MDKNKINLTKSIGFLLGLNIVALISDITGSEYDTVSIISSIIGVILLAIPFYFLKKDDNKKAKIFCLIVGILEMIAGIITLINLINKYDSIDLNYKYLLFIIPIADLLIGAVITYQANKLNE